MAFKQITLRLTSEDFRKLKAEQARLGENHPTPPSYSNMAHQQWLGNLPAVPERTRKRRDSRLTAA